MCQLPQEPEVLRATPRALRRALTGDQQHDASMPQNTNLIHDHMHPNQLDKQQRWLTVAAVAI